eukprot:981755_1
MPQANIYGRRNLDFGASGNRCPSRDSARLSGGGARWASAIPLTKAQSDGAIGHYRTRQDVKSLTSEVASLRRIAQDQKDANSEMKTQMNVIQQLLLSLHNQNAPTPSLQAIIDNGGTMNVPQSLLPMSDNTSGMLLGQQAQRVSGFGNPAPTSSDTHLCSDFARADSIQSQEWPLRGGHIPLSSMASGGHRPLSPGEYTGRRCREVRKVSSDEESLLSRGDTEILSDIDETETEPEHSPSGLKHSWAASELSFTSSHSTSTVLDFPDRRSPSSLSTHSRAHSRSSSSVWGTNERQLTESNLDRQLSQRPFQPSAIPLGAQESAWIASINPESSGTYTAENMPPWPEHRLTRDDSEMRDMDTEMT